MNGFILFCSRFALSLHQIVVIMTIKEFFSFRQNKYFWINILAMIAVVVLLMFGTLKGIDIYTHHGEAVVVPDVKGMTVAEAGAVFDSRGWLVSFPTPRMSRIKLPAASWTIIRLPGRR
mgnify:CR=1 FL=1